MLRPLVRAGRTAICGGVLLEMLMSARNAQEHAQLVADFDAEEWLRSEDEDFRRAIEVQGELARIGRHRAVGVADLVIAAVAERHRVALLHSDADFEIVGEVTGQPTQWVVPRGSVD